MRLSHALRLDSCTSCLIPVFTPRDDSRLLPEFPHARIRGRAAVAAGGERDAKWIEDACGHGTNACDGIDEVSPGQRNRRCRKGKSRVIEISRTNVFGAGGCWRASALPLLLISGRDSLRPL